MQSFNSLEKKNLSIEENGFPSCMDTTLIPLSEVSHSKTKFLVKYGITSIGVVHITFQILEGMLYGVVPIKRIYFKQGCKGRCNLTKVPYKLFVITSETKKTS
jgi:hypothetical protein